MGASASMTSPNQCPSARSTPITGYPVTYGSGSDGVVIVAFFSGTGCPADVLQYQATVQLIQPVSTNTA